MIKLDLLKTIIKFDLNIDEINNFKNEFSSFYNNLKIEYLYDINSIPKLNKNKKEFLKFINKYKILIDKLISENILEFILNSSYFSLSYNFKEYINAINNAKTLDKNKFIENVEKIEKLGFSEVYFETLTEEILTEHYKKKYNSDDYEIKCYITDGKKEYLSQYYGDVFPIKIKDYNIIIEWRDENIFGNNKKIWIYSFDINFNKIPADLSNTAIINSVPFKEIKKITSMCNNLCRLDDIIDSYETNLNDVKKILEYDELNEFFTKQLDFIKTQITLLKENRNKIIEKYKELGYEEDFIDKCVKYLKKISNNSRYDDFH